MESGVFTGEDMCDEMRDNRKSRTEYSAKNTSVSLICRALAIIMGYVLRIVFTHNLSSTYVGINGLFVDIIQVLSLSEMGVGTAITFALYQPIAQNDIEKQKSLMKLFQKFYYCIALIVAVFGIVLVPFLGNIIRDYGLVKGVVPIFLLYVTNAVCSYLLIYKKMLIDAHQLNYIGVSYQTISWIVQDILQILVLILSGNFVYFLLVQIMVTITCNCLISHKANRMYPFLKEREVKKLPEEDFKSITRNIRAMMMHKVGEVVINNTDNLLISVYVSIVDVGRYSNYYLLIMSVNQVLEQVFQGIAASVGNLGVTEDNRRVRKIFETTFFIGQWMYAVVTLCIFEVINPFVEISFGKQYTFSTGVVILLCLRFYIIGIRKATQVFRDSLGLFRFDRYKAIVEAVLNVILSLIFVQQWGVFGVFLGTIISMLSVSVWIEPYVLYHFRLQVSVMAYFKKLLFYVGVTLLSWGITDWICGYITGGLCKTVCLKMLLCLSIPNIIFLFVYHRCPEFLLAADKAKRIIYKVLHKRG